MLNNELSNNLKKQSEEYIKNAEKLCVQIKDFDKYISSLFISWKLVFKFPDEDYIIWDSKKKSFMYNNGVKVIGHAHATNIKTRKMIVEKIPEIIETISKRYSEIEL